MSKSIAGTSLAPCAGELDDRVAVRRSTIGRGLFAVRSFHAREPIMRIGGRIVDADVLWKVGGRFAANCLRFGPETYLDPGSGAGRYVNHSCDPNAGIAKFRNRLILLAARRIRPGEEITLDYSTTIGDDDIWTMRCRCGGPSCRRTIANFGSLPPARQRRYMTAGLVPAFIVRTLVRVVI
ncbi:MAG TPA: SET domain-containing protein-lysine N-methyltransferase [Gemmatimonadaceae bacterium]|jgi:hypothetical protein|nr:SET domain-containing protein-lysine N-methyltransferase [Gemmatimonadaceae bacterium]